MTKRILIMGLPGAGKTTLAQELINVIQQYDLKVIYLNADKIREEYNDWDFTTEGRIRQSKRMYSLSTLLECDYVIADFVAPLVEMRENYNANFTIWVDTITESRFADTNRVFVPPVSYDVRVTEQDSKKWVEIILQKLWNE